MNKFLLSAFLILAFCAYYGSSEDPLSSPEPMADLAGTEVEQRAAHGKSSKKGDHKKKEHSKKENKKKKQKKVRLDAPETNSAADDVKSSKALVKPSSGKGKEKQSRVRGLPDLMFTVTAKLAQAGTSFVTGNFIEALVTLGDIGQAFMEYIGIL